MITEGELKMQKMLLKFMIAFIMKQIEKLEKKIDWIALEKELDEHIRKFFPIKFLDEDLIFLASQIFKAIEHCLAQHDYLQKVVELVAQEKFDDALKAFEVMLKAELPPESPVVALL